MATPSTSGAARNANTQQAHFIRRRVQYTDTGFQAGARIGRIPARSYIQQVTWHKTTAFNSGTSDNATIGTTAGAADILASTVLTGTGFINFSTAAGLGMAVTAETDVFLKWLASAGSTQAATAGDVTVVIMFAPDNDG